MFQPTGPGKAPYLSDTARHGARPVNKTLYETEKMDGDYPAGGGTRRM